MRMDLSKLTMICLFHGMTMAGTRDQILFLLINPWGQVLATILIKILFLPKNMRLPRIWTLSYRHFSRNTLNWLKMNFTLLENHMLDTIFHLSHRKSINFKGLAIGNGLTNPRIQYQAYPQFALDNKLITKEDQAEINKLIPPCLDATDTCGVDGEKACETALQVCQKIFTGILDIAGNINYYDIRKKCEGQLCYDFSNLEKFLNNNEVKEALGVGKIEFVSCSSEVYDALVQDWMFNYDQFLPELLENGIKVLIYAGEYDLICNWIGNSQWVHAMKWSGQKQFGASKTVPFLVDGKNAGSLNSYGALSFLKVNGAGHMVPMDQPKASLQMLVNWIEGKLNGTKI
ncbi:variant 2, Serine carboxypeptidase-like 48 [Lathyrus oleraceus]|uniref:Variant 2, Serine carboxypeptidase-like 48 n=1 Tax=Pisum sativum TaxID=3888 RepID=A0A9D4VRP8_PEA|nr:variant 2, Serine carboxypeptidase-like 48 [Pisum sativum]